jgi:hypothetical protein
MLMAVPKFGREGGAAAEPVPHQPVETVGGLSDRQRHS